MSDRALLEDLIAKLREMEEHLVEAELESESQAVLRGRIRHLYILAAYVRAKLVAIADPGSLPPNPDDTLPPDSREHR